jgi:predicted transglutaminase-like cysteine proteinase
MQPRQNLPGTTMEYPVKLYGATNEYLLIKQRKSLKEGNSEKKT